MYKFYLTIIFFIVLSNTVFAQKKGIEKFYVNEKLYCTHTFFINP